MTGRELLRRWEARDERYALRIRYHRFMPLSAGEQAAIRVSRFGELNEAREPGLTAAVAYHRDWRPPARSL